MARKPTPKTGRKAWEAELKLLQKAIKKAQGIGLFIEDETITPPKRATQKQVAKLTAKRKEILQNVRQTKQTEKPSLKIRQSAKAESTSGRMTGVGSEKRQISTGMSAEARKARAKKAAETRKKREAALSPEERKRLKEKRAKQLEKNLGHEIPLPEIDTIPEAPPDLIPPQVADYPQIAEIVWYNYNQYLDRFENKITNRNEWYAKRVDIVNRLNDFIQNRIAQVGLNAFLLQVETDADEFQENLDIVFFDSEDSAAEYACNRIIMFLQGKVLSVEQAKELEVGYEAIIDDSDLMPIDLGVEE